ncbi:MAG: amidohydrolase family protein [Thermoplasmataceae archaeon]
MKYVKATTLYDGKSVRKNCFIAFERNILEITEKKPSDGEMVGEGVVTPGFIDAHSHIGMVRAGEPSSEDESNEHMDNFYPLVRAADSVYMDDSAFGESVENGVLYSTVLPGSGNTIGGRASLLRNFKGNIQDAFVKDIGIKAALGYNPRSTTDWKGTRPNTRMGAMALLRETLYKAQKASNLIKKGKKDPDEIDPLTEIFMDILSGKYKLMVHTHKEDDADLLIGLKREFGLKVVLNHGVDIHSTEAFRRIASNDIPIVYGPMDSHPYKVELKHESWRNTQYLLESGAKFCLMSDHPVILQRTIFYTLRHLLRFGLSKEQSISKLTSETASILGLEDLGMIETGKLASLTVWNGDPFSLESHPVAVFGEGEEVYSD